MNASNTNRGGDGGGMGIDGRVEEEGGVEGKGGGVEGERGKGRGLVVTAPGKVLITGGYLVLERPNTGIVLSVNARFYTSIHPFIPPLHVSSVNNVGGGDARQDPLHHPHEEAIITVSSPQFHSKLEYRFTWHPSSIFLEKMYCMARYSSNVYVSNLFFIHTYVQKQGPKRKQIHREDTANEFAVRTRAARTREFLEANGPRSPYPYFGRQSVLFLEQSSTTSSMLGRLPPFLLLTLSM